MFLYISERGRMSRLILIPWFVVIDIRTGNCLKSMKPSAFFLGNVLSFPEQGPGLFLSIEREILVIKMAHSRMIPTGMAWKSVFPDYLIG
jgi:hypothetical protein